MNRWFRYTSLVLVLVLGMSSCQTYVGFDDIALGKEVEVERNSLILSSDTPAEVELSYCVSVGGRNELVRKTVTTPYMLDLGRAVVVYDSLNMVSGKRIIMGVRRIKHLYSEGGAEYLRIHNKSDARLSVAIIGRQSLWSDPSGDSRDSDHPMPIYRGVPLLYLLRPEETPREPLYYTAILQYNYRDGNPHVGRTRRYQLNLAPEHLKEMVGETVPLSVDRVMSLYQIKERNLFLDYSNWSLQALDASYTNDEFRTLNTTLYWEIPPREAWQNAGRIPLFAQKFDDQNELR